MKPKKELPRKKLSQKRILIEQAALKEEIFPSERKPCLSTSKCKQILTI